MITLKQIGHATTNVLGDSFKELGPNMAGGMAWGMGWNIMKGKTREIYSDPIHLIQLLLGVHIFSIASYGLGNKIETMGDKLFTKPSTHWQKAKDAVSSHPLLSTLLAGIGSVYAYNKLTEDKTDGKKK